MRQKNCETTRTTAPSESLEDFFAPLASFWIAIRWNICRTCEVQSQQSVKYFTNIYEQNHKKLLRKPCRPLGSGSNLEPTLLEGTVLIAWFVRPGATSRDTPGTICPIVCVLISITNKPVQSVRFARIFLYHFLFSLWAHIEFMLIGGSSRKVNAVGRCGVRQRRWRRLRPRYRIDRQWWVSREAKSPLDAPE